jgi:hypothetical protein
LAASKDTDVHEPQIEPRQQIAPMCARDQASPEASAKLQAVPAHLPRVNVTIPGDFGRAVKFVAWTRSFVLAYC